MLPRFISICGPTSSGKTSLALQIAKETNSVIVSADSRQICKYMDIGTGKVPVNSRLPIVKNPNHWLIDSVRVYGYDLVTPSEFYSSYDYANYARTLLDQFIKEGTTVLLVGGTGYYFDTVLGKVTPSSVGPDLLLREKFNNMGLEELLEKLKAADINEYNRIDTKNKVRVVRALEKLFSNNQISKVLPELLFRVDAQIGLTSSNDFLFKKVDDWVTEIWQLGLLEETKNLIKLGYAETAPLNGLIYKTVVEFIQDKQSEKSALERIKFDLHAYIRRQKTWFKRNSDIHWYDVSVLSSSQIKSDVLKKFSV